MDGRRFNWNFGALLEKIVGNMVPSSEVVVGQMGRVDITEEADNGIFPRQTKQTKPKIFLTRPNSPKKTEEKIKMISVIYFNGTN